MRWILAIALWGLLGLGSTLAASLESNPLPPVVIKAHQAPASTQLYVTQFINPAEARPSAPPPPSVNGSESSAGSSNPFLNNLQTWTNQVSNQFGVGVQINF